MLRASDESGSLIRRLDAALANWGAPDSRQGAAPAFPSAELAAARLRERMESAGRAGTIRTTRIEGSSAFVYVCFTDRGQPYAQGVGETPDLAVLEAFLECAEPRSGSGRR